MSNRMEGKSKGFFCLTPIPRVTSLKRLPLLCSPSQHKDAESYFGKCRKITGQIKCVEHQRSVTLRHEKKIICVGIEIAPTSV